MPEGRQLERRVVLEHDRIGRVGEVLEERSHGQHVRSGARGDRAPDQEVGLYVQTFPGGKNGRQDVALEVRAVAGVDRTHASVRLDAVAVHLADHVLAAARAAVQVDPEHRRAADEVRTGDLELGRRMVQQGPDHRVALVVPHQATVSGAWRRRRRKAARLRLGHVHGFAVAFAQEPPPPPLVVAFDGADGADDAAEPARGHQGDTVEGVGVLHEQDVRVRVAHELGDLRALVEQRVRVHRKAGTHDDDVCVALAGERASGPQLRNRVPHAVAVEVPERG